MAVLSQPIIKAIHAVGQVKLYYHYNGKLYGAAGLPKGIDFTKDATADIELSGFRLDSDFLTANPLIASSMIIPMLGGGGLALTNNTRAGTLVINCTHVGAIEDKAKTNPGAIDKNIISYNVTADEDNLELKKDDTKPTVYDAVLIAQAQQSQPGGDANGATLSINFQFNGQTVNLIFEGCTVATVDPIILSGNNAPNYSVVWNYLSWGVQYAQAAAITASGYGATQGGTIESAKSTA